MLIAPLVPVEVDLARFEEAASVRLATTFDLRACKAEEDVAAVVARLEREGIDFAPVKRGDSVVGVLARAKVQKREATVAVAEVMQPLGSEIFVAGSEPLLPVIESLDHGLEVRLVIESRRVLGILTLSDLQKLPVRSLLFGRIAHVEMLLMNLIRYRAQGVDEEWLSLLSYGRRRRALKKFADLRMRNSEIEVIEATDFCDKRDLVIKLGGLPGWKKKELNTILKDVENLRNQVAHATKYADSRERALKVVRLAREMRRLIASLGQALSEKSTGP